MDLHIPVDDIELEAELRAPSRASGCVVFVHGSGSSRLSPRNKAVAEYLNSRGLVTLLFDLLTPDEAENRVNVFDIETLARRLVQVTKWLRASEPVGELPIGFFGASTGAAAALVAAEWLGPSISAVVSRGGRVDLAGQRLKSVQAPTLLIVGSEDKDVLHLNESAAASLTCEHELTIVQGATHLFEEHRALETVASLTGDWFARFMPARSLN